MNRITAFAFIVINVVSCNQNKKDVIVRIKKEWTGGDKTTIRTLLEQINVKINN